MTSVDPTGAARPARVAGLALLGVAVVALVIGLITVFGGNGASQADGDDQPTKETTGQQDTSPTEQPPTTEPEPTTTRSPAPTTGGSGQTSASGPAETTGTRGGSGTREHPVRVYNNSTTEGLATKAAEDLGAAGWDVVEVDNYGSGIIPTTTVYFRPGTGEQDAAREIANTYGMRVEERFAGIADAAPGVIVIVTNDYQGPQDK